MLLLVKIWQVSSCGKINAAPGNLFTDIWSWQSFVPSCNVFNCLFLLDVQNEYSCYRDSSVIHGWFVYCAFEKCTACRSHWKSDFGCRRFQNRAYSVALVWGVRGLKSIKRFWLHLIAFRSSISTGKPKQLLSLMCLFSGFLESSVVYAASLWTRQWSDLK